MHFAIHLEAQFGVERTKVIGLPQIVLAMTSTIESRLAPSSPPDPQSPLTGTKASVVDGVLTLNGTRRLKKGIVAAFLVAKDIRKGQFFLIWKDEFVRDAHLRMVFCVEYRRRLLRACVTAVLSSSSFAEAYARHALFEHVTETNDAVISKFPVSKRPIAHIIIDFGFYEHDDADSTRATTLASFLKKRTNEFYVFVVDLRRFRDDAFFSSGTPMLATATAPFVPPRTRFIVHMAGHSDGIGYLKYSNGVGKMQELTEVVKGVLSSLHSQKVDGIILHGCSGPGMADKVVSSLRSIRNRKLPMPNWLANLGSAPEVTHSMLSAAMFSSKLADHLRSANSHASIPIRDALAAAAQVNHALAMFNRKGFDKISVIPVVKESKKRGRFGVH